MRREDSYIDVRGIDPDALLQEWRWLIGPGEYTLAQATAIGDLFLADEQARIFYLGTLEGEFSRIAESEQDLLDKLKVRANRAKWLSPLYIQHAQMSGMPLGPGQCYGWKIPPVLGGQIDSENAEPSDLLAYHSILGQLFRQLRAKQSGSGTSST